MNVAKLVRELLSVKHFIRLLTKHQWSKQQLAKELGVNLVTVCRWVDTFHNRPRNLLYISEYKRPEMNGPFTKFYSWGPGQDDVVRPPPLTRLERKLKARDRIRRAESILITPTGVIHVSNTFRDPDINPGYSAALRAARKAATAPND